MFVVIRGGMGNQMFQSAFGIALANKFGVAPKYLDFTSQARVGRTWALACFGIEPLHFGKFSRTGIGAVMALIRKTGSPSLSNLLGILMEFGAECTEVEVSVPPWLISGYWQRPAFFLGQDAAIRRAFRFPVIPTRWDILPADGKRPRVAIHVRRGDYISDPVAHRNHFVCDERWYRRAWTELQENVGDCHAVVFSDDIGWARMHLDLEGQVSYIPHDLARPTWVDMALMSKCEHFITSNSTFGWWAAYLGQFDRKFVIAPSRWFPTISTSSLGICPASWKLV